MGYCATISSSEKKVMEKQPRDQDNITNNVCIKSFGTIAILINIMVGLENKTSLMVSFLELILTVQFNKLLALKYLIN